MKHEYLFLQAAQALVARFFLDLHCTDLRHGGKIVSNSTSANSISSHSAKMQAAVTGCQLMKWYAEGSAGHRFYTESATTRRAHGCSEHQSRLDKHVLKTLVLFSFPSTNKQRVRYNLHVA